MSAVLRTPTLQLDVATTLARLTPPDRQARYLGSILEAGELAVLTGGSVDDVDHWAREMTTPAVEPGRRLTQAFAAAYLVAAHRGADASALWLRSPSRDLDGVSPLDALRAGDDAAVSRAATRFVAGLPPLPSAPTAVTCGDPDCSFPH